MERWFKNILKIAGFVFTAPATIAVVSKLDDKLGLWLVPAQVAGLLLIEGVMLLGWWALDNRPTATNSQRWLYSGFSLCGWLALVLVALWHEEGFVGVAFRIPLLLAILYSVVESGILANINLDELADRDILRDWQVRSHARKLDRLEAKAEREAMSAVRLGFFSAEEIGGKHAAELHGKRLQEQNELTHNTITHTTNVVPDRQWDRWIDSRTKKKQDTRQQIVDIRQQHPDISSYEIAKMIGKSDTTVNRHLKDIAGDSAPKSQPVN